MKVKFYKDKIIDREKISGICSEIKKAKKTIITTNGCFDILHIGHVDYLQRAAELGDYLIVGVNSQESMKRLKGNDRPVNDENARIAVIAALGFVDYCIVFNEDTPVELLKKIKPDIHVKGGDYKPDDLIEKKVVEDNGGQVMIVPFLDGYSTSGIISKIKNR